MHTLIQRPAPSSRPLTAAAPGRTNRPLTAAELDRITAGATGIGLGIVGTFAGVGAVFGKK